MIRPVGEPVGVAVAAAGGAAAGGAAVGGAAVGAGGGAAVLCAFTGIARAAPLGASTALAPAETGAPTSNTISGEPTATLSPGFPVTEMTLPLTGAGTSTAALSVITSTMI